MSLCEGARAQQLLRLYAPDFVRIAPVDGPPLFARAIFARGATGVVVWFRFGGPLFRRKAWTGRATCTALAWTAVAASWDSDVNLARPEFRPAPRQHDGDPAGQPRCRRTPS